MSETPVLEGQGHAYTPAHIVLGVVVPCFDEEKVLPEAVSRIESLLRRLVEAGLVAPASRMWLVDDGSRDGTWPLIEGFSRDGRLVCGIRLSRNRGHQNALLAGLFTAEGDALVTIDADLQDDVDSIEQMVREFAAGSDIVYGVRRSRKHDPLFKRQTARGFYWFLERMGVETIHDHADFRLMSRRAVEALREYSEVNLYLRGIVPLIGYRYSMVAYDRSHRFAGETKYPLRKMLSLAVDAVTSFSVAPLRLIGIVGVVVCFGSVAATIWALGTALVARRAVPGWASTVLPIYFFGGLQLLSLGVIGEYVGKLYLEAKRRPRFVVDRVIGAGARSEENR